MINNYKSKMLDDERNWNKMTAEQKTDWFINQCKKYNLTVKTRYNKENTPIRLYVEELPCTNKAYFTAFLPHKHFYRGQTDDAWTLEIGGSYVGNNNGGIWKTDPGLLGKELQIKDVMDLHQIGQ